MNKLIEIIKADVLAVKNQNKDVLSVDAMLNYLDHLDNDLGNDQKIDQNRFDADIAAFKAENERNIAQYEAEQQHSIELLRSVISYGQAALKSAILINGGAAVALLAFIGNIWLKAITPEAVTSLTNSIALFAFGVLAAALGTAGSYFTQYCYSESHTRTGIGFHLTTIMLVLGAYVLFGFGACESYHSFEHHLSSQLVSPDK